HHLRRDRIRGEAPEALAPGCIHRLPRRDLPGAPQLGGEGLPKPDLFQRSRQGRPLRLVGGAGALLGRDPGRLQLASLTNGPAGARLFGDPALRRRAPRQADAPATRPDSSSSSGSGETGFSIATQAIRTPSVSAISVSSSGSNPYARYSGTPARVAMSAR